jgi:hypothetical protein
MVLWERCLRALLRDHGFTISVFGAVAITAMFAFAFEASQEFVASLLILGVLTAAGGARLALGFRAPAMRWSRQLEICR